MLRSKSVVGCEYLEAAPGKAGGDRPVRPRGAKKIASAMKIQQRRSSFVVRAPHPLAFDAANAAGGCGNPAWHARAGLVDSGTCLCDVELAMPFRFQPEPEHLADQVSLPASHYCRRSDAGTGIYRCPPPK